MEENVIDETETNAKSTTPSVENLEKEFQNLLITYNKELGESFEVPMWFKDVMRTSGTRNITLETWNSLCANVRKLAANDNAVADLLEKFKDLLKKAMVEIDNEIATADKHASNAEAYASSASEYATSASNYADNAANAAEEAANKALANKVDKIAPDDRPNYYRIYCSHSDGINRHSTINAVSDKVSDTIPIRNSDYTFSVGTPKDNAHPATKQYVDINCITDVAYNASTGVIALLNGNGVTVKTIDLPVERILENATLSEDGKTLYLNFRAAEGDAPKTVNVDVSKLVDRAWVTTVNDAEFPPTSKAIKAAISSEASTREESDDALGKRIDERVEAHNNLTVRVNTLDTSVSAETTARVSAVSALNKVCSELRNDITNLQALSNTEYEVTTVEGVIPPLGDYQLDNAMPIATWITKPSKYTVSLPFDCSKATVYGSAAYLESPSANSVVIPSGMTYYVKIPIELSLGLEYAIKVCCDGANDAGESIDRYNFLDDNGNLVSTSILQIGTTYSAKTAEPPTIKYLLLYKKTPATALTAPINIKNIRVYSDSCVSLRDVTPADWQTSDTFNVFPGALINTYNEHASFKYIRKLPKEGLV